MESLHLPHVRQNQSKNTSTSHFVPSTADTVENDRTGNRTLSTSTNQSSEAAQGAEAIGHPTTNADPSAVGSVLPTTFSFSPQTRATLTRISQLNSSVYSGSSVRVPSAATSLRSRAPPAAATATYAGTATTPTTAITTTAATAPLEKRASYAGWSRAEEDYYQRLFLDTRHNYREAEERSRTLMEADRRRTAAERHVAPPTSTEIAFYEKGRSTFSAGIPAAAQDRQTCAPDDATPQAPLYSLPTREEKLDRLVLYETTHRAELEDAQVHERHVLAQMRAVHYIAHVHRVAVNQLELEEYRSRQRVKLLEERARHETIDSAPEGPLLQQQILLLQTEKISRTWTAQSERTYAHTPPRAAYLTVPSPPPTKEENVHLMLQRYVRQRHAAEMAEAAATSAAAAAKRRETVLSSAAALLLEDDRVQSHRALEREESLAREGLTAAAADDLAKVKRVVRKRFHLQRLLYWRQQREARAQRQITEETVTREMEALAEEARADPRFLLLQEVFEEGESYARDTMEDEEKAEVLLLLRPAAAQLVLRQRAWGLESLYQQELEALFASEWEGPYLCAVEALEGAARTTITSLEAEDSTARLEPAHALLQELGQWGRGGADVTPSVVVLQRAWRRAVQGWLGWHHTHKRIGAAIRAARDEKVIQRGRESLEAMRAALRAEEQRICTETIGHQRALQEACVAQEAQRRTIIATQEEEELQPLLHWREADMDSAVVAPLQQQYIVAETNAREWLLVAEADAWGALQTAARQHRLFCGYLHNLKKEEGTQRAACREEEAVARDILADRLFDGAEAVALLPLLDRHREAPLPDVLHLCAEAIEANRLAAHGRYVTQQQLRWCEEMALDDLCRGQLYGEAVSGMLEAWAQWATEAYALRGQEALAEWTERTGAMRGQRELARRQLAAAKISRCFQHYKQRQAAAAAAAAELAVAEEGTVHGDSRRATHENSAAARTGGDAREAAARQIQDAWRSYHTTTLVSLSPSERLLRLAAQEQCARDGVARTQYLELACLLKRELAHRTWLQGAFANESEVATYEAVQRQYLSGERSSFLLRLLAKMEFEARAHLARHAARTYLTDICEPSERAGIVWASRRVWRMALSAWERMQDGSDEDHLSSFPDKEPFRLCQLAEAEARAAVEDDEAYERPRGVLRRHVHADNEL